MNRITSRFLPKAILVGKSSLVAAELAVQVPRADTEATHGFPFARNPDFVVWSGAGVRARVEEELVGGGQGNADYDGLGDAEEALAQEGPEGPGVGGGEGGEDERGVGVGYGFELGSL